MSDLSKPRIIKVKIKVSKVDVSLHKDMARSTSLHQDMSMFI